MVATLSESPKTDDVRSNRKPVFHFWRCFWLTFLVVSLGYAWYSFYVPANDIAWAQDFRSAQQQAVASKKPIILYFSGTWCAPCRIMKRQVWADEEVMALVNKEFIPLAIDVDAPENASLLSLYQIKGPPVTIVTDPQGNALGWRAGKIDKAEFFELLEHPTPPEGSNP